MAQASGLPANRRRAANVDLIDTPPSAARDAAAPLERGGDFAASSPHVTLTPPHVLSN